MEFGLTQDQQAIVDGVRNVAAKFDDDYWLERDRDGGFPHAFYDAVAGGGWLGIAMPEAYGGAGLGVTEAALMMETIAGSGGAMAASSSVHMNIFGPHAIIAHGSDEQKRRWLPGLIDVRCVSRSPNPARDWTIRALRPGLNGTAITMWWAARKFGRRPPRLRKRSCCSRGRPLAVTMRLPRG
jgi:hypothetical protein